MFTVTYRVDVAVPRGMMQRSPSICVWLVQLGMVCHEDRHTLDLALTRSLESTFTINMR
jgi:hypothetical protein